MDFTLKKEHEMARQLFKDFAQNEVKPLAQETDETEIFPRVTVDKLAKYGMLGIPVPREYGGSPSLKRRITWAAFSDTASRHSACQKTYWICTKIFC